MAGSVNKRRSHTRAALRSAASWPGEPAGGAAGSGVPAPAVVPGPGGGGRGGGAVLSSRRHPAGVLGGRALPRQVGLGEMTEGGECGTDVGRCEKGELLCINGVVECRGEVGPGLAPGSGRAGPDRARSRPVNRRSGAIAQVVARIAPLDATAAAAAATIAAAQFISSLL